MGGLFSSAIPRKWRGSSPQHHKPPAFRLPRRQAGYARPRRAHSPDTARTDVETRRVREIGEENWEEVSAAFRAFDEGNVILIMTEVFIWFVTL